MSRRIRIRTIRVLMGWDNSIPNLATVGASTIKDPSAAKSQERNSKRSWLIVSIIELIIEITLGIY